MRRLLVVFPSKSRRQTGSSRLDSNSLFTPLTPFVAPLSLLLIHKRLSMAPTFVCIVIAAIIASAATVNAESHTIRFNNQCVPPRTSHFAAGR